MNFVTFNLSFFYSIRIAATAGAMSSTFVSWLSVGRGVITWPHLSSATGACELTSLSLVTLTTMKSSDWS